MHLMSQLTHNAVQRPDVHHVTPYYSIQSLAEALLLGAHAHSRTHTMNNLLRLWQANATGALC